MRLQKQGFYKTKCLNERYRFLYLSWTYIFHSNGLPFRKIVYCKTLIFRCILISRFWSLENLRHFNFAFLLLPSSPLNFLLSALFRYGFNTPNLIVCRCTICTLFNSFFFIIMVWQTQNFIFFSSSEDCLHLQWGFWYSMQMRFWWWAYFKFAGIKIRRYLISRFYSIREIREN